MKRKTIVVSLCSMLFVTNSYPVETTKQTIDLTLPEHGSIGLKVPASWKYNIRRPPDNLPPTITFTPDSGHDFLVKLTPLWSPKQIAGFNSPEKIKPLMKQQGKKHLVGAEEKELIIKELKGNSGLGYYYSFTDKTPKPGEYKFMTQGALGNYDLLISFTILTNTKNSVAEHDALDMLRNIVRHEEELQSELQRVMKCWKCGKTFRVPKANTEGKCPYCGASWKSAEKDTHPKEIVRKCDCSMSDFKLSVMLAFGAGYDLKERVNSYDLYKCSLGNWEITAQKVKDGLEIHMIGDDLDKGEGVLKIMIDAAEKQWHNTPESTKRMM